MLALRHTLRQPLLAKRFAVMSPYRAELAAISPEEAEAKKTGDYTKVTQIHDWENYKSPFAPYEGQGPLPPVSSQIPIEAQYRLGFIPETYFKAMEARLGYSGGYTLLWGGLAALTSKEWITPAAPEFRWMFCGMVIYGAALHMGVFPYVERETMIKEMAQNDRMTKWKAYKMSLAESEVDGIARLKEQADGLKLIQDQRKNNLAMALEAEYTNRQADLTEQVKKRLDYHVAVKNAERDAQSKHMINWIENEVMTAISKRSPKEDLTAAIGQLKAMAK